MANSIMPKQVRFTQLVKNFGRPYSATLWAGDPKAAPEFKQAIDENRILTIHNVNAGTKTDVAEIGFKKEGNPSYLIFPKALSMAAGTRVIGLKFNELEEAPVVDPIKVKEAPRTTKVERVKTVEARKSKPEEKDSPSERSSVHKVMKRSPEKNQLSRFTVKLQFKATVQRDIEVQAKTAAEAIAAATKRSAKSNPQNPAWETEALEVKKSK